MSLLSSSRVAVRSATLPPELLVACLHTSTPVYVRGQRTAGGSGPSRTRLVKDLTPTGSSGKLRVGRDRELPPHKDRDRRDDGYKSKMSQRLGRREEARSPVKAPTTSRELPESLRLSSGPHARDVMRNVDIRPREAAKPKVVNPLSEDFDLSRPAKSSSRYTEFSSPPLMDGLLKSVHDILGPDAEPTPIQALALEHLLKAEPRTPEERARYQQWLLASETGSGKSMAYLLPVLQDLKLAELSGAPRRTDDPSVPRRAMNPRALVLAPTHELTRQLAGFAKELLHNVKLRVVCASRANAPSRKKVTAAKMAEAVMDTPEGDVDVSSEIIMPPGAQQRPVDLLVGTPSKILELARGRGWDYEQREAENSRDDERRPHRKFTVGEPEMGLADVEWVIVDEADVLFDPDFQEATRLILADISAARGHPVPFEPELDLAPADPKSRPQPTPIDYPFNLVLTSATIPSSLAAYISRFHPSLTRLASPHLHRLPSTLKTEHFNWTGGNRDADIEHRLRRVWYEDLQRGQRPLSKILVFCNKSARAENLGAYLREKGVANVVLSRESDARKRGSNHHLDGFLRVRRPERDGDEAAAPESTPSEAAQAATPAPAPASGAMSMEQLKDVPHVMITTSLLSRGLDFAPDVKHVFIVDEPRNMIDFLHRAGRSGRAGEDGKVVVFGKAKGRGSEKARVVRKKVGALKA
ncbi:P-loop containing nucleoside triphosphate hydrolase protein [Trametes sanguinea]|nr:P-loop containing nucleoside triphosphate hydrolase protein [Trametes sanguinea]